MTKTKSKSRQFNKNKVAEFLRDKRDFEKKWGHTVLSEALGFSRQYGTRISKGGDR